jgi:hypothetical protein
VLAVAACSSGSGAYVTVDLNGTAATSVALYIGQNRCTTSQGSACTAIDPIAASPSGTTTQIDPLPVGNGSAAGAWFQSDNVADGLMQGVPAGTHQVVFHVEAGDDPTPVQLVAIGSDSNGPVSSALVYDLTIPADSAKPVDVAMTLEAAQPAANHEGDDVHPDGTFVDVWDASPMLDPISCVVVEQWTNHTASRMFIVPPQDADCDGFATYTPGTMNRNPRECRELWFDYTEPSKDLELGDTSCAASTLLPSSSVCVAGGSPCIDGTGTISTVCSAESVQVCIPTNNCIDPTCATPQSSTSFDTCSKGTDASAVISCTITTTPNGDPCDASAITGPNATPTHDHVDLAALFPQGSTATCKDIWIAQQDSLISPHQGGPKIELGQTEFDLTLDGTMTAGTCGFDIDWKNGDQLDLPITPAKQVIGLDLTNGNTLMLPIELVQTDCQVGYVTDHALACSVVLGPIGDPITSCAM